MKRRTTFNPKRQVRATMAPDLALWLCAHTSYTGNPEHKRNPGDFGLTPPAIPRPDKTLCDTVDIFSQKTALKLLRAGIKKGLISIQTRGSYPQNIWAVTTTGLALEAQLENAELGTYHGYPMPQSDPFRDEISRFAHFIRGLR